MKNFRTITILTLILITITSCFFDRKSKDVDSFYFTRNFGQFPLLPLIKPIKLLQDDQSLEWQIKIPYSFGQGISTNELTNIGTEKTFIYGKTLGKKRNLNKYNKGDNVYMYVDGSVTWTKDRKIINNNIIEITSFDTIYKSFIEPERWFVINVADSTTEAFFSKKKYQNYLKEKGISGKMYNINKYHKQYKQTGILPWFPDSIKAKLKK